MSNIDGRCDLCGAVILTGGCGNRGCPTHGLGASQDQVMDPLYLRPSIEEIARTRETFHAEFAAKLAEAKRKEHEQRVFDMLRAVATDTENFDAVSANNYAEQLVAEFEKRMKEQGE